MTDTEKDILIENIWKEKKGRVSTPSPYALFVAIDSPRPKLSQLAASVLETLSQNSLSSRQWSRSWGKVVVCVQPGGNSGCVLGDVNEPKNKRFIPVNTTVKVDPSEIIKEFPGGGAGKIVLNSQPTTIEAFLISFVHLTDELILDTSLRRTHLGNWDTEVYGAALEKIKKEGFSLEVASTDEILSLKFKNPNASVRLYGSGVNKDVPKVMGAIVLS